MTSEKTPTEKAVDTKEMPAEVKVMLTRLEEIKTMDKLSMNYSEKKHFVKKSVPLMQL
ncbi:MULTISPECIES: hypothetical protein [unclassified Flavobacterium]|uniref:hypothetical protein n=1 Tax=unclassified Flavobacterium TaxID=196869 RepID=UPI0025C3ABCC|nr:MULTISPECIES: hypothetical protein [unclassified Flavobacterium]